MQGLSIASTGELFELVFGKRAAKCLSTLPHLRELRTTGLSELTAAYGLSERSAAIPGRWHVQGDLMLKMDGQPYYGTTFARMSGRALFGAQVSNYTPAGGGTTNINIEIEHKNSADVTWATAGSFAVITADGLETLELGGLKEWLRYKVTVAATNRYDGACIFTPSPMWLQDI